MTTLVFALVLAAPGDQMTLIAKGMTQRMGGYMPIRAEMGAAATGVTKKPADLAAPQYGVIKIGDKAHAFILDEPEGKPARLFVDSNADGDLTNDPATVWAARTTNGMTMYSGSAEVSLQGQMAAVNMYRFDKNDPGRAQLKNTLLYYADFGFEGTVNVGGTGYKILLAGAPTATSRVWIDRNANGKNDGRSESYMADKPFNFGGTTYALTFADGGYTATKSTDTVDEIPLPPDLSVGAKVPGFSAVSMTGDKIDFPRFYKGKVVMLDFWATWCGPCIAELPNVIAAYNKYHDRGFDVLGISFDQANMAEKVTAFTKERKMPWQQIYEGKYWETTLGRQFGVEGIPFCLLVDGDTGEILANVGQLRGEALDKTIQGVLAKRGK